MFDLVIIPSFFVVFLAFYNIKIIKELDNAKSVCAQAYQLVGQFIDQIHDVDKWLDNLNACKVIHKDLIPTNTVNNTYLEIINELLDTAELNTDELEDNTKEVISKAEKIINNNLFNIMVAENQRMGLYD